MDPSEILNIRFHIGGQFIHNGPVLYVGGDEEMSHIERDKLSLQEVRGHLKDHVDLKESVKLYFLYPGKELADGLVFLFDDSGCMNMADYICIGDVADIYVEYHGEQDSEYSSSVSDYENEIMDVSDMNLKNLILSLVQSHLTVVCSLNLLAVQLSSPGLEEL